ncbi:MAG: hypothetical protein Q9203_006661 [Teloschistes exilis]
MAFQQEKEILPAIKEPACHLCVFHWRNIATILADAFAGLYINPSPKAAISSLLSYRGYDRFYDKRSMPWGEKDFSLRLWLQAFRADDLGMDARDGGRLLGSCNGSSVLFPTSLARLKMSNSSRFTYQLSDGCFVFNDRYFHKLEAGFEKTRVGPPIGPEMIVDKIVRTQPGSSYHIDVTLTESFSAIKIWVRANIRNHITILDLHEILVGYEQFHLSEPCDHPYCTPLDTSIRYMEPRLYRLPEDIFEAPYEPFGGLRLSLYMVHKEPQLQFLCLGNGQEVQANHILFMRDCCLNCALQQAVDKHCPGIIVS